MMSAYGTAELAVEALQRGAYDYLAKPFEPSEVVLTLRKARSASGCGAGLRCSSATSSSRWRAADRRFVGADDRAARADGAHRRAQDHRADHRARAAPARRCSRARSTTSRRGGARRSWR
jgi:DNA-binding NtrC family response regulator